MQRLLDRSGVAAKLPEQVPRLLNLARPQLQLEWVVEVVILKAEMALWLKLGQDPRRQVSN